MARISDEDLDKLRHDLRSPLVVIGGFAQLLAGEREIADADRRDYAERIQRAAEDLSAIIDRALDA
jgi:signal transduction histidine kinase